MKGSTCGGCGGVGHTFALVATAATITRQCAEYAQGARALASGHALGTQRGQRRWACMAHKRRTRKRRGDGCSCVQAGVLDVPLLRRGAHRACAHGRQCTRGHARYKAHPDEYIPRDLANNSPWWTEDCCNTRVERLCRVQQAAMRRQGWECETPSSHTLLQGCRVQQAKLLQGDSKRTTHLSVSL